MHASEEENPVTPSLQSNYNKLTNGPVCVIDPIGVQAQIDQIVQAQLKEKNVELKDIKAKYSKCKEDLKLRTAENSKATRTAEDFTSQQAQIENLKREKDREAKLRVDAEEREKNLQIQLDAKIIEIQLKNSAHEQLVKENLKLNEEFKSVKSDLSTANQNIESLKSEKHKIEQKVIQSGIKLAEALSSLKREEQKVEDNQLMHAKEVGGLREEKQKVELKLHEIEQKFHDIYQDNTKLSGDIWYKDEKISGLIEQIKQVKEEQQALKISGEAAVAKALSKAKEAHANQLAALNQNLDDCRRKIISLESEIEKTKDDIRNREVHLHKVELSEIHSASSFSNKCDELIRANDHITTLEKRIEKIRETYANECMKYSDDFQQVEAELIAKTALLAEKQTLLDKEVSKVEGLTVSLEHQKNITAEEKRKVDVLILKEQSCEIQTRQLQNEIAKLQQALNDRKAHQEKLREAHAEMNCKLLRFKVVEENLSAEIKRRVDEKADLKSALQNSTTGAAKLSKELNDAREKLLNIQQEYRELNKDNRSKQETITELRHKISVLNDEKKTEKLASATTIEGLQAEILQLSTELARSQERLANRTAEQERLEAELNQLKIDFDAQRNQLKQNRDETERERNKQNMTSVELSNAAARIQEKMEKMEEERAQCMNELNAALVKCATMEEAVKTLQNHLDVKSDSLIMYSSEKEALQRSLERLKTELNAAKVNEAKSDEKLTNLQQQFDFVKSDVASRIEQQKHSQNEADALRKDNHTLTLLLTIEQANLSTVETNISNLKREMDAKSEIHQQMVLQNENEKRTIASDFHQQEMDTLARHLKQIEFLRLAQAHEEAQHRDAIIQMKIAHESRFNAAQNDYEMLQKLRERKYESQRQEQDGKWKNQLEEAQSIVAEKVSSIRNLRQKESRRAEQMKTLETALYQQKTALISLIVIIEIIGIVGTAFLLQMNYKHEKYINAAEVTFQKHRLQITYYNNTVQGLARRKILLQRKSVAAEEFNVRLRRTLHRCKLRYQYFLHIEDVKRKHRECASEGCHLKEMLRLDPDDMTPYFQRCKLDADVCDYC